jgi:hypothetical protein
MTDSTGEQQKPWQFKPGKSGNPAGRPKGSRNKLGEAFIEALHDDFMDHGAAAIVKVREEKPDQYMKVIASLLPKDVNLNINDTSEMTDDELAERVRQLAAQLAPFLPGGTGDAEAGVGHASSEAQSSRVH